MEILQVVPFDDGTYGLRNQRTGKFLGKFGAVLSYKTEKRAHKAARRLAREYNKELRRVSGRDRKNN